MVEIIKFDWEGDRLIIKVKEIHGKTRLYSYKNKTLSLYALAKKFGILLPTLRYRMKKLKLSVSEAIEFNKFDRPKQNVDYNGENISIKRLAVIRDMSYLTLWKRINQHEWSIEDAAEASIYKRIKKAS